MSYRYVVLRKSVLQPSVHVKRIRQLSLLYLYSFLIAASDLVPLELTSDGTGGELDSVCVGKEALGVSLELSDGESSSGIG
jgi:hypothetical protein